MENLHGLTPLHFLEIWFKMENLHGLIPLHFLEIWFEMENLHGLINPFTFSQILVQNGKFS